MVIRIIACMLYFMLTSGLAAQTSEKAWNFDADIKHSDGCHTLRVTMEGDHIQCYYDGGKYLDVKDSTFQAAGKIGLWTKADAQSYFDDLTMAATKGL